MPGSPPINTSDPGTNPPPRTLSNSSYPLEMRSILWFCVWLINSERYGDFSLGELIFL